MWNKFPGWVRLIVIFGAITLLFSWYGQYQRQQQDQLQTAPSFSELAQQIKEGKIAELKVSTDGNMEVKTIEGKSFKVFVGSAFSQGEILERFRNLGVTSEQLAKVKIDYSAPPPEWMNAIIGMLPTLLLIALIGGFFIFMMRGAQGQNNQVMSFGKSGAKMFVGHQQKVTFADVAGCAEAVEEVKEVVEFLKYPEKFSAVGARIPRGVLLVGPPGTGKTLLARAVAGQANVPFFSISGSEFVQMFVGVGASRVRDLFDTAKRNAPCIVFIDEIDAVGRQRGTGIGGTNDEREQTLNQILVAMDGFDNTTNVIVIGATNRPDVLDPGLLRPGRFDRQVVVDRPDIKGRREILDVHVRGKPLEKEVELLRIAKISPGFTGADLANLVNEAAILAARGNKKTIGQKELEDALEKVALGPERKSRVINKKEKRIIAIHEGGHALVKLKTPLSDPVHKVSIVARGMAEGVTWSLPEEDSRLTSRGSLLAQITGALGGRAAEEILLGGIDAVTTGATNDLRRATELARQMVTEWGMSEKLGPQTFGTRQELIFLGKQVGEEHDYSNEVARSIDEEVKLIIDGCYAKAKGIITANKEIMEKIVERLLVAETLSGEEFARLVSNSAPTGSK